MDKEIISADREVDDLYAELRARHGGANPRANGYVYEGSFRREQQVLVALLDPDAEVLVDVGCGSGLMVQPLIAARRHVVGVDFNRDACRAARANGLSVVRGDAFQLPFAASSIDEIVTCQFFNQQPAAAVRQFITECARVLRARGRVVMVWRNGEAWIHRLALAVFGTRDRLRGRPRFPYENHSFHAIGACATAAGLRVRSTSVSFPPLGWHSDAVDSIAARVIGASNICVLEKPG
jgi:SAM-dependent methyltransferase